MPSGHPPKCGPSRTARTVLTCSGHLVALLIGELPGAVGVLLHVRLVRAPLLHAGNGVAVKVLAILDDGENAAILLVLDVDLVASRRRHARVAVAEELGVEKGE